MSPKISFLFILIFSPLFAVKAQIVSGPMQGNVSLRTAQVWVETKPNTAVSLKVSPMNSEMGIDTEEKEKFGFHYTIYTIYGMAPDMEYDCTMTAIAGASKEHRKLKIKTGSLWPFRKPAPDITILAGSCAYINEEKYDRPGKPYGSSPKIFESMAKVGGDACFWLGDNWYYREVDYDSEYGLYYRPHHDRAIPEMQNLLSAMPHYAQWDDHDYGPNNSNMSYVLKKQAREVFQTYWLNPSYGYRGEGIFTKVNIADVDFFILDNRWFRNDDEITDNGKPYLGTVQLAWLKNGLKASRATFKVILTGSQVLNDASKYETYLKFEDERNEFFGFLKEEGIRGVLFMSGDRHHSSVFKNETFGDYTYYDVTISPFTSGTYKFSGAELNPANRILGIDQKQNFGKISVTGPRFNRVLKVDFLGLEGELLDSWSVSEKELKAKK